MRHRITYGIIIIPLIIALLRARTRPYFATDHPYEVLNVFSLSHPAIIAGIVALSVLTTLLTLRILEKRRAPREAYVLLLFSPPVLAAPILDPIALVIALAAATSYLVRKTPFAAAPLVIASYIHPSGFILSLAAAMYFMYTKRYVHASLLTTACALVAWFSPTQLLFASRFAELQAPGAISIIALLLGVLGTIILWDENKSLPLLITLVPLLAGIVIPELSFVTAVISAYLGGHAMRILYAREWQLKAVKTATTYFIILGLLFAATASTSQAIVSEPSADLLNTAQLVNELTDEPVSTLSTQKAALRWYGVDARDAEHLRNVESSTQIRENATTYLLIENGYEAPRLHFLLENSNAYVLVHDREHQLWRYTH